MKTTLLLGVALAALLTACGEQPQTIGAGTKDKPAYNGTGKAFVEPGWKPGDKASWQAHLKARGQNTQNENNKTN